MYEKAVEKTRLKRDTYRVLGSEDVEATLAQQDKNLFNDHDCYQLMLNDFLQSNDRALNEPGEDANDKTGGAGNEDFLYGADLSLTQKYLLKKQRLKELEVRQKKDIDRRASKGRKIKYVVHDKLLNFMAPRDNFDLLEGKDSILSNLFSLHTTETEMDTKKKSDDNVKLI